MNDELLAMVERDVLDWPGVIKETHRAARARAGFGFHRPPSTSSAVGRWGIYTTPA
jgi:hypothetical protein